MFLPTSFSTTKNTTVLCPPACHGQPLKLKNMMKALFLQAKLHISERKQPLLCNRQRAETRFLSSVGMHHKQQNQAFSSTRVPLS